MLLDQFLQVKCGFIASDCQLHIYLQLSGIAQCTNDQMCINDQILNRARLKVKVASMSFFMLVSAGKSLCN
jgi:hypothetical protein